MAFTYPTPPFNPAAKAANGGGTVNDLPPAGSDPFTPAPTPTLSTAFPTGNNTLPHGGGMMPPTPAPVRNAGVADVIAARRAMMQRQRPTGGMLGVIGPGGVTPMPYQPLPPPMVGGQRPAQGIGGPGNAYNAVAGNPMQKVNTPYGGQVGGGGGVGINMDARRNPDGSVSGRNANNQFDPWQPGGGVVGGPAQLPPAGDRGVFRSIETSPDGSQYRTIGHDGTPSPWYTNNWMSEMGGAGGGPQLGLQGGAPVQGSGGMRPMLPNQGMQVPPQIAQNPQLLAMLQARGGLGGGWSMNQFNPYIGMANPYYGGF